MKLNNIIEDWEELMDEYECESFEDLKKELELTGELMIAKGQNWGYSYDFYCGPSIGNGCVSDTAYIECNYFNSIIKELNAKIDIHVAENYHTILNVDTDKEADEIFDNLKNRLSNDFPIDIES
jgi:hypothetical protein